MVDINSNSPKENSCGQSLANLMERIVQTHHAFCRNEIAGLAPLFKEAIVKQGNSHPELKHIHNLFLQMSRDLSMHLLKEEQTLFPYIARVEDAVAKEMPVSWPPFGTVESPIRMMVLEHLKTDDELDQIRKLSNGYNPPADACEAMSALYERLAAFDRDMRQHIDSENNDLFPRAVRMEEEACNRQKVAGR